MEYKICLLHSIVFGDQSLLCFGYHHPEGSLLGPDGLLTILLTELELTPRKPLLSRMALPEYWNILQSLGMLQYFRKSLPL